MHPNLDECFFLRMLLVNVPGLRSFQQLKIVDEVTLATFRAECNALNIMQITFISTQTTDKKFKPTEFNLYKTYALFYYSFLIHAT